MLSRLRNKTYQEKLQKLIKLIQIDMVLRLLIINIVYAGHNCKSRQPFYLVGCSYLLGNQMSTFQSV